MAVNIVTGMTGTEHITSDDFRAMNAALFGNGKYVLPYGTKFSTEIISNNQIRVSDGMCINQGTQMGIELTDYTDVVIENGISGASRNDIIVMRYTRNVDTSMEDADLVVIKGASGAVANDPEIVSGNILDGGDLIDDMPLFRVRIESLTIAGIDVLYDEFPRNIGGTKVPLYMKDGELKPCQYELGAASGKNYTNTVEADDDNLVTGGAVHEYVESLTNVSSGTWKPTPVYGTNGQTDPDLTGSGMYTKIGKVVFVSGYMYNITNPRDAFALFGITNLPYKPSATGYNFNATSVVVVTNNTDIITTSDYKSGTYYDSTKDQLTLTITHDMTRTMWYLQGYYFTNE